MNVTDETPAASQELDVPNVPDLPEKDSTEQLSAASVDPNCPCGKVLNGTHFCGLCRGVLPQLEKFQRSKTGIQQNMEQLQETLSLFVAEKTNYLKKIVGLFYFLFEELILFLSLF